MTLAPVVFSNQINLICMVVRIPEAPSSFAQIEP